MQNIKTEIVYQSNEKNQNGTPFMTVKKARGYYMYAERVGMDSIAFILYDSKLKEFGLIYESKPPMDEREGKEVKMTTAFGGSIDMQGKKYEEICQIEVEEETGYEVPMNKIHFVGKTMVSTQMSQFCYLYLVDVTGIKKTKKTEHEINVEEFKGNEIKWLNADEMLKNSDWKSIFIFTKAIHKDII